MTAEEMLSASTVRALPLQERIGLMINSSSAKEAIQEIIDAEQAGVRQIWPTQAPTTVDVLSVFSVAAEQTSTIRLGTSIPDHTSCFRAVRVNC